MTGKLTLQAGLRQSPIQSRQLVDFVAVTRAEEAARTFDRDALLVLSKIYS